MARAGPYIPYMPTYSLNFAKFMRKMCYFDENIINAYHAGKNLKLPKVVNSTTASSYQSHYTV